jgi:hypothetical protein
MPWGPALALGHALLVLRVLFLELLGAAGAYWSWAAGGDEGSAVTS